VTTVSGPDAAPLGTVVVSWVLVAWLTAAATPPNWTLFWPALGLKPSP